jgi:hypothetical protein
MTEVTVAVSMTINYPPWTKNCRKQWDITQSPFRRGRISVSTASGVSGPVYL